MRSRAQRQSRSSQPGAAFVELVMTLPVLLALLIGTADFARVFYTSIELINAARAGAQYGAKDIGSCCSFDAHTAMETKAKNSVNISGIVTAAADHTCQCAQADGSFPDIILCTDACPSPKFRVITVTVTASAQFNMISKYPGIPRTLNISRASVMRVTE
jgi:Flp pilus assembly protein TadG